MEASVKIFKEQCIFKGAIVDVLYYKGYNSYACTCLANILLLYYSSVLNLLLPNRIHLIQGINQEDYSVMQTQMLFQ